MIPVEQTRDGTIMFLACGCGGWRLLAHPTGAAVAVNIVQRCAEHAADPARLRSVKAGELVHPFTRTPATIDPIQPR
jgi:hypothetical protein